MLLLQRVIVLSAAVITTVSAFSVSPHCHNPRSLSFVNRFAVKSSDSVSFDETVDTIRSSITKKKEEFNVNEFLEELQQSVKDFKESLTTMSTIPYTFQGQHSIYAQVSRPGIRSLPLTSTKKPAVLLVHGFGCSTYYWRETISALTSSGYTVYAMDLLGHGQSDKPTDDVHYSTNLWAQQITDFIHSQIHNQDVVLVGNSMGSTVSLLAAANAAAAANTSSTTANQQIKGVGMFNCGIGMNVHSIVRDEKWNSIQRWTLDSIFNIFESTVFSNVALIQWILESIVTKDLLRTILLELYVHAEQSTDVIVNKELVDSFYNPVAKNPKQVAKVLSQILTNDGGLTPMEIHSANTSLKQTLIHVIWGQYDTVTPIDGIGQVAQFYQSLAHDTENENVTFDIVQGGHVPFDEIPTAANQSLLTWLNQLPKQQQQHV